MLHASSNRGTPTTGENITKLVRQNYKPLTDQPYVHEHVQCRTEQNLRKNKPEDYWNHNFYRRQSNLQRGFYSSATEPYKPIGGQLILDPYELVLSALPGNVDIKVAPRINRRGTIYEEDQSKNEKSKGDKLGVESATSLDDIDLFESAGFDDIRRLLNESKQRIISVRAGMPYEEHVKLVEDINKVEKESQKPEESGMRLHSVSSMFLPSQLSKSPGPDSSRQSSPRSLFSPKDGKSLLISDLVRSPLPARRLSRARPSLRPPSMKKNDKLSLIQISSGITSAIHRKERLFRDHYLYLKSIFNILTALHNMKVRDIRSKTPLSKDVVERLMKEQQNKEEGDGKSSRGTYGDRWTSRRVGRLSNITVTRPVSTLIAEIDKELDPKNILLRNTEANNSWTRNTKPRFFGRNTDVSTAHMDEGPPPEVLNTPRMSIFGQMKKFNAVDNASKAVFGRRKMLKARRESRIEKGVAETNDGDTLSVFQTVKKMQALDSINKNFLNLTRRRSRNASSLAERPALETWEDLLNVQPEQYKEEQPTGTIAFQVGVVAKFMRWYRRSGITPLHSSAAGPLIDKSQLAHLQDLAEDTVDKPEKRESVYVQQQCSAVQQTEKARKLTLWQQVAQEKSTVFQNSKDKDDDSENVIKRFEQNLNKLKKSVQKENTAEIEKMIRERIASFRLKFGTLSNEECSPLFEEQQLKLHDVKDNVNKIHLENFDIKPSKWYEELREKTLAIVSSYCQPSLMEMLTKVQVFAHMDNKTVSYAKPKLCLLMMSLPAYDICQIHTQRALKFIFENILLGQEAQFQEWLNHRKIPYVVIKDPKNP
ncbi:hypothetical protein ACF0H5_022833 [Mactra antiquata]